LQHEAQFRSAPDSVVDKHILDELATDADFQETKIFLVQLKAAIPTGRLSLKLHKLSISNKKSQCKLQCAGRSLVPTPFHVDDVSGNRTEILHSLTTKINSIQCGTAIVEVLDPGNGKS
jgi:hypothetical protein